jgi:hypothetical protein
MKLPTPQDQPPAEEEWIVQIVPVIHIVLPIVAAVIIFMLACIAVVLA